MRRADHVLHAETVASAEVETVATVVAVEAVADVATTVRLNKEYSDIEYKIEWWENFRPLFFLRFGVSELKVLAVKNVNL